MRKHGNRPLSSGSQGYAPRWARAHIFGWLSCTRCRRLRDEAGDGFAAPVDELRVEGGFVVGHRRVVEARTSLRRHGLHDATLPGANARRGRHLRVMPRGRHPRPDGARSRHRERHFATRLLDNCGAQSLLPRKTYYLLDEVQVALKPEYLSSASVPIVAATAAEQDDCRDNHEYPFHCVHVASPFLQRMARNSRAAPIRRPFSSASLPPAANPRGFAQRAAVRDRDPSLRLEQSRRAGQRRVRHAWALCHNEAPPDHEAESGRAPHESGWGRAGGCGRARRRSRRATLPTW